MTPLARPRAQLKISRTFCTLFSIGIVLACESSMAWAQGGGIALYEVSTPHAGEAYAGQAAVADDASTAFLNPAGMTRLGGRSMLFGGQLATISAKFHSSTLGGPGTSAGTSAFMPGVYYVDRLGDRFRFGFSLNTPLGLALQYGQDWPGRYFVNDVRIAVMDARPTLAYRVNNWLSLGGGASLERASVNTTQSIRNVFDPGYTDGQLNVSMTDWAVGYNAGALFEVSERTRFGIMYRSNTDFELNGRIRATNIGPTMMAMLAPSLSAATPLHLPAGLNFSVFHAVSRRLTLLSDAGWTNWRHFGEKTSVLPNGSAVATDAHWRDTWRAGLGMRYLVSPNLTLQAGTSYDSSPVSDWNRTPETPVNREIRMAVGAQHPLRSSLVLGVSYTYLALCRPAIRNLQDPLSGTLSGYYSPSHLSFLAFTLALTPKE
jgi:long-chain fatty acid transport protein